MLKIIPHIISRIKNYNILIIVAVAALLSTAALPGKKLPVTVINGVDYISLHDLTELFDVENSFDPVNQKGRLYYKNHYMVYKSGYCVAIIDNNLYTSQHEIVRYRGGIYVPADMAERTASAFFTDMEVVLEKGGLFLGRKTPSGQTGDEKKSPAFKGRIGFIIIDPGHGGRDPGAVGKGGVQEKDITLSIGLKIEGILKKKYPNLKIKMTRNTDRFVELARRADIANRELKKNVNGIFVSVHVNASISPRISGFETYFLSQNPTNDDARKTAALENNVLILENGRDDDDVEYMEALMITTQIQKESSLLAAQVQRHLDRRVSEFKSRGVHRADFFVLRGALMPAVLVETGFVTNRKESSYLKKSDYQDKISNGICDGIIKFIEEYNKMIDQ